MRDRRFDRHVRCSPSLMVYGSHSAKCGGCGLTWFFDTVRGYRLAPTLHRGLGQ